MFVDWTKEFPNLSKGYSRTSSPTIEYNCFAWALGDNTHWWEPDPLGFFYWPPNLPRIFSVQSYVRACELHGFRTCNDGAVEPGFQKIVIYTLSGHFTHAARQLPDGRWTSKLGQGDDIAHLLDAFDGSDYGMPTVFLRRAETAQALPGASPP